MTQQEAVPASPNPLPTPQDIQETQKHRFVRDATAGIIFNLGTTAILPSILSGSLDVFGLASFAFEGRSVQQKVKKMLHEENHVNVRFPRLRMAMADAVLPEHKMRGMVNEWIQKEEEHIQKEIDLSKLRERRTLVREIVYPPLLGAGRTGIDIITRIPHQGDGLGGFMDSAGQFLHNPHLFSNAFEVYQHDFLTASTLMTAAVVLTTLYGLNTSRRAQQELSGVLKKRKATVKPTAEFYMENYTDKRQNLTALERGFQFLSQGAKKMGQRFTRRN